MYSASKGSSVLISFGCDAAMWSRSLAASIISQQDMYELRQRVPLLVVPTQVKPKVLGSTLRTARGFQRAAILLSGYEALKFEIRYNYNNDVL